MQGTRLGPYEVLEQIGAGGMGEVWLARDSRLNRRVAIKVLPPEFVGDAERLARFEQEARSAAALAHPNIAVVYDVGEESGIHFFVQEYLEGETLQELIDRDSLGLHRSLELSAGIARGLAAAHREHVVHRDLKPANIFVTEDGEPKILDFGLAKMTAAVAGGSDAESPTQLGTTVGAIMGTAGYMAPEQVQAGPIDGRTDLFALGCVLYEMVSGARAFAGDSVIQTLNRIVHEPARPLDELMDVPAELLRIVGKCLAKDPRRRFQTAADLAVDLDALIAQVERGELATPAPVEATAGAARRSLAPGWVLGAVAGALLLGAAIGWLAGGTTMPEVTSFSTLTERIVPRNDPGVTIAPDGRSIAFVGAGADGTVGLFVRSLDDGEIRAIPDTSTAHSPFFSPDSEWVGYFNDSDRSLRRVAPHTGDVRIVSASTGGHRGATWTDDGSIVFASFEGGLGRVSAEGGEPQLFASGDEAIQGLRFPRFLPGTGDVLVTFDSPASSGTTPTSIGIVDAQTGTVSLLLEAAADPRFLDPDLLLFRRRDTLYVVGFDPGSGSLSGEPVPLFERIARTSDGPLVYDVARNGALVFVRADYYPVRDQRVLVEADRAGRPSVLPFERSAYTMVRVAPDGQRLAVQVGSPGTVESKVVIVDLDSATQAPVAAEQLFYPLWSDDGEWLAVTRELDWGRWGISMYRADLSGERREIDISAVTGVPAAVDFGREDSTFLLMDLARREDLWSVPVSGDDAARLVTSGAAMLGPTASPDGRWLAFSTRESGRPEIYVLDLETGGRVAVSRGGGEAARWRGDGRELYYWSDRRFYAVALSGNGTGWSADPPELLFEGDYLRVEDRAASYGVAPDGSRFYLIRDDGPPGWQPTRIELVLSVAATARRAMAEIH